MYEKNGLGLYPKSISKSLKCIRLKLRFDGENESFSAEFMWSRVLLSECQFHFRITED